MHASLVSHLIHLFPLLYVTWPTNLLLEKRTSLWVSFKDHCRTWLLLFFPAIKGSNIFWSANSDLLVLIVKITLLRKELHVTHIRNMKLGKWAFTYFYSNPNIPIHLHYRYIIKCFNKVLFINSTSSFFCSYKTD